MILCLASHEALVVHLVSQTVWTAVWGCPCKCLALVCVHASNNALFAALQQLCFSRPVPTTNQTASSVGRRLLVDCLMMAHGSVKLDCPIVHELHYMLA